MSNAANLHTGGARKKSVEIGSALFFQALSKLEFHGIVR